MTKEEGSAAGGEEGEEGRRDRGDAEGVGLKEGNEEKNEGDTVVQERR